MDSSERSVIWTVGHSNHCADTFRALVSDHKIDFVLDVRSWPHSRYAEWADRDRLPELLSATACDYAYCGQALGGRPNEPEFYDETGRVLYGHVARDPIFLEAVDKVEAGACKHRLALMCSEENPEHCHRRLLISKVLMERGVAIEHIRGDGRIEQEKGVSAPAEQGLFDTEDDWWRSTASVSQRRRPKTSSRA